jgi:hypothetical protein
MRALTSLFAATLLGACGAPTMSTFFPADGADGGTGAAVAGFVKDPSGKGLQIAEGDDAIEALVDGAATPFMEKGVLALGRELYIKDSYHLEARVWQMKDAANASVTYDYLLTNASLYKASTWTALSVGDAGRIADDGTAWWVNARKGAYLIDVRIDPNDATSRSDVEAFAKALVAKM